MSLAPFLTPKWRDRQAWASTTHEHMAGIHAEAELKREATIRKFRIVQVEGARQVSRAVDYYRLDATRAVGYRVRSARGTAFLRTAA